MRKKRCQYISKQKIIFSKIKTAVRVSAISFMNDKITTKKFDNK